MRMALSREWLRVWHFRENALFMRMTSPEGLDEPCMRIFVRHGRFPEPSLYSRLWQMKIRGSIDRRNLMGKGPAIRRQQAHP